MKSKLYCGRDSFGIDISVKQFDLLFTRFLYHSFRADYKIDHN